MTHQLWALSPATYVPHPIHRSERTWPESNCYVDLWIELLHAARLEPIAALPFTLTIDLESDQWTFFKFPSGDLALLYGADIFELNVWRPLPAHVDSHVADHHPVIVEVDAFHLPDTRGTSYRTDHVKTSIAIQAIDVARRRIGYFHNAGYHQLEGADYEGVFRLDGSLSAAEYLAPYVEVVKLAPRAPATGRTLVDRSLQLLASHLARRPATNPFRRYARQFAADIEWLASQPLVQFHRYAFATLRQFGAAFELASTYLRWLEENGEGDLGACAEPCDLIAVAAKTLQFKTARVVHTHRPFDAAPLLEMMADAWDQVMSALSVRYGGTVATSAL